MKLTNKAAQRLLGALRSIDRDETVNLGGKLRLDVARNINRLMADVEAFERAIARRHRDLRPGEAALDANGKIMAEIEELGDLTVEVKLYKLNHNELNLGDNKRITGEIVAALGPILRDFDDLDDGGE